jgi:hypothetical protein
MKKNTAWEKAFTIIEVIIFVAILNIVFIAMAGYTARLIYSMKINEHKLRANIYAEELREWLNGERDTDWATLYGKATPAGATYCINRNLSALDDLATNFAQTTPPFPCNYVGITGIPPTIYRRWFVLRRVPPSQVNVDIVVSWFEGQTPYSETIQTIYVQ